jgi:hypothetical protein
MLINEIIANKNHFGLILNDDQSITTPVRHDTLSFIIGLQPPRAHVVIATLTPGSYVDLL